MISEVFKATIYSAGSRSIFASWLANVCSHTIETVGFLLSHYGDGDLRYSFADSVIGTHPGHAHLNDAALNFFARVILENKYDFVIELGAFSLERSARLAKLFPSTEFFALDVGPDYITERTIDGVALGPNTLPNISAIAKANGRGLILSHGTFAYYDQPALDKLLALASSLNLDIALLEPNAIGESSRTVSLQRTKISRFHPYIYMMTKNGYALPDARGHQVGMAFSTFGEWYTYIFAEAPKTSDTSP